MRYAVGDSRRRSYCPATKKRAPAKRSGSIISRGFGAYLGAYLASRAGISPDYRNVAGRLDNSSGTSYSQSIENARGSLPRRSPESVCYGKNGSSSGRKSRKTVSVESRVCYETATGLAQGHGSTGSQLYYRHTVPVDAQRLLNGLEIWRSLRTNSLAIAARRLPSVIARIEMEIEHARAMAGLPVGATLIRPLKDDFAERAVEVAPPPSTNVQADQSLTLGEAYRSYLDDPTRAWAANTREAYEASRRLAIAVMGEAIPVSSIARAHCRDMIDVPANAGELSRSSHRARRQIARACAATSRSSALQTPIRSCRIWAVS